MDNAKKPITNSAIRACRQKGQTALNQHTVLSFSFRRVDPTVCLADMSLPALVLKCFSTVCL